MLNNCVFVGVLLEEPTERETASGAKFQNILLGVKRPFKNPEGVYDEDRIRITIWKSDATKLLDYAKAGSILAVKGRLQSNRYEKDDKVYLNYEVYGEKISLISQNNA